MFAAPFARVRTRRDVGDYLSGGADEASSTGTGRLFAGAAVTMTTAMTMWVNGVEARRADGSLAEAGFAHFQQVDAWVWVLALLGAGHAFLRRPIRGLATRARPPTPRTFCTRRRSSRWPSSWWT